MKSKLKKYLYFDASDPLQTEIFHILDRVRYFQTKLIVKLLSEFFERQGISSNTPPDRVKIMVQLYLDGEESPAAPASLGTFFSPDVMIKMIQSLLPQTAVTEHSTPSSISGISSAQLQALPSAGIKRQEGTDAENSGMALPNATEPEISKLRQMAQGFLSMASE